MTLVNIVTIYDRSPDTLNKKNVFGIEHMISKIIRTYVSNIIGRSVVLYFGVQIIIRLASPE